MTKRIALKLLARPVGARRTLTAARRVLRYVGNDPRPACDDCPIGGREAAGPRCPRTRSCDRQCAAQTLALDIDNGRHPWGPWRCLMQRAESGEAFRGVLDRPTGPFGTDGNEYQPANADDKAPPCP